MKTPTICCTSPPPRATPTVCSISPLWWERTAWTNATTSNSPLLVWESRLVCLIIFIDNKVFDLLPDRLQLKFRCLESWLALLILIAWQSPTTCSLGDAVKSVYKYLTERSSGMCEVDGERDRGHRRAQLHQRISQSDSLCCPLRTGDKHRLYVLYHRIINSAHPSAPAWEWHCCLSAGEGPAVVASVHAGTGNLSGWSWPERKHSRPCGSSVWTPDLYSGVWCGARSWLEPKLKHKVNSLVGFVFPHSPCVFIAARWHILLRETGMWSVWSVSSWPAWAALYILNK